MKLGTLFALCGALAIAGCSNQASPASPTPKSATEVANGVTLTPTAQPVAVASGTSFQKGAVYLKARNYTAAEEQFRLSITDKQRMPESYSGLGTALVGAGDYMSAYHAFKNAAALDPANASYYYHAGFAALYAGDYHAAVDYVNRYLRFRPRDVNAYHLRFEADAKLLQRAAQIRDARIEIYLAPRNPEVYNDLGIAYGNSGKYKFSEQALTRAIQLSPTTDRYYLDRAFVENLDHKQPAALRDLREANTLTSDPTTKKNTAEAIKNLINYMATH
jgi:tetratricopeptide (TPR) repeat protein